MSAARKLTSPNESAPPPLLCLYRGYLEDTGDSAAAALFALDEYHRTDAGRRSRTAERTVLTPPQVAKQLGVDPSTVIGWIRTRELKASNVGKGGQRPRYRIQQADLGAFMRKRQPAEKPAVRKSRRKHDDDVIEFF
jgi:excisionase family DNA binding protein